VTERPYIELEAEVEADRLDETSEDVHTDSYVEEWIDPRIREQMEQEET
jgi:hypothetical protein